MNLILSRWPELLIGAYVITITAITVCIGVPVR